MGYMVAPGLDDLVDFGLGVDMAVSLVEREGAVGLGFADEARGKPFFVDFATPTWRRHFAEGLSRNHIFRRALGAAGAHRPVICDATAGFGADAVLALALGCEVTAIERSDLVIEVLRDGIGRAARESAELGKIFGRMRVMEGDAVELLPDLNPKPDVVFLDPMFDKPKKRAKSPKSMQLLQELLGPPPSSSELNQLFGVAWETCRSRVVVKRPLKASALRPGATHSFKGQSVRYDIYVKASSKASSS